MPTTYNPAMLADMSALPETLIQALLRTRSYQAMDDDATVNALLNLAEKLGSTLDNQLVLSIVHECSMAGDYERIAPTLLTLVNDTRESAERARLVQASMQYQPQWQTPSSPSSAIANAHGCIRGPSNGGDTHVTSGSRSMDSFHSVTSNTASTTPEPARYQHYPQPQHGHQQPYQQLQPTAMTAPSYAPADYHSMQTPVQNISGGGNATPYTTSYTTSHDTPPAGGATIRGGGGAAEVVRSATNASANVATAFASSANTAPLPSITTTPPPQAPQRPTNDAAKVAEEELLKVEEKKKSSSGWFGWLRGKTPTQSLSSTAVEPTTAEATPTTPNPPVNNAANAAAVSSPQRPAPIAISAEPEMEVHDGVEGAIATTERQDSVAVPAEAARMFGTGMRGPDSPSYGVKSIAPQPSLFGEVDAENDSHATMKSGSGARVVENPFGDSTYFVESSRNKRDGSAAVANSGGEFGDGSRNQPAGAPVVRFGSASPRLSVTNDRDNKNTGKEPDFDAVFSAFMSKESN